MNAEKPFPILPEGTVTFLFTDIEGSTELLKQLRDSYATVLNDQRRILRENFSLWNGQEVDTQGDSFFVSFMRASEAVAAAVAHGRANVGLGIETAACRYGLDFIPVAEEQFDFVFSVERLTKACVQAFQEVLRSDDF